MKEPWTTRWFRKRALAYHLLALVIVPGCLYAGWWQVHRAMAGNTLSYLYSVEWPVFAILAVIGWWQLIHEDPAAVESRKVERARRAATTGPFVPPSPDADSGFYHPLQPSRRAVLDGQDGADERLPVVSGDDRALIDPATGEPVEVDAAATPVHALSSYNAYLARLAAGNTRKSWRNPHGLAGRRKDRDG